MKRPTQKNRSHEERRDLWCYYTVLAEECLRAGDRSMRRRLIQWRTKLAYSPVVGDMDAVIRARQKMAA